MKIVGQVTEDEKNIILDLYEKKTALENLTRIINPDNESMYNKMIKDYGKVVISFNDWWRTMQVKYNWPEATLRINFSTNEIIKDD